VLNTATLTHEDEYYRDDILGPQDEGSNDYQAIMPRHRRCQRAERWLSRLAAPANRNREPAPQTGIECSLRDNWALQW